MKHTIFLLPMSFKWNPTLNILKYYHASSDEIAYLKLYSNNENFCVNLILHWGCYGNIMAGLISWLTCYASLHLLFLFFQGQAKATKAYDDFLSILSSKVWYLALHWRGSSRSWYPWSWLDCTVWSPWWPKGTVDNNSELYTRLFVYHPRLL
jgi:hypothetical protein